MSLTAKRRTAIILIIALLCTCILIGTAAAATEKITNGDFSNGLNGWQVFRSSGLSNTVTAENGAAHFSVTSGSSSPGETYVGIYQTVDLTNVQTLTWKSKKDSFSGSFPRSTCLRIYASDRAPAGYPIATYWYTELGSGSYTTQSYDVSSITGTVNVAFEGWTSYDTQEAQNTIKFYIDDISAIDNSRDPVLNYAYYTAAGQTDKATSVQKGDTVSVTYSFTDSIPSGAYMRIFWDDDTFDTLTAESGTVTHTYSNVGTYNPFCHLYKSSGSLSGDRTLADCNVYDITFSVSKNSVDVGETIYFTASVTSPTTGGIAAYAWNFGDGTTGVSNQPTKAYTADGLYDVTLSVTTTSNDVISKTIEDMVNVGNQAISFSEASAASGETVDVEWTLRDANYPYNLYIYPSYNTGLPSSYTAVASHTINSAADTTYTWTTGAAGYYTAYILKNGNEIIHTNTPVNVVTLISLTVNVFENGVSFLDPTTVSLYKDSTLISELTTATGQNTVTFEDIETGTYYVTIAATDKTTRTSPNLVLTDSYTLSMDFTLGSSESSPTGAGSQYASTFVTFRCQDSGTGKYLPNVQIVATAVEATNAWEYFANLFGASIGTTIQSMTLSGMSDSNGVITFAMYPNVRYQLTITYDKDNILGKYYTETRSFQPSVLTAEYLIAIPITDISASSFTENIVTTVNTADNSIIANLIDKSGTVTSYTVTVYYKNEDERTLISSQTQSAPTINEEYSITFPLTEPDGKSYIVSYEIHSGKFGDKTQEYGVTFGGVKIKIGNIPDEWYIWISFGILIMLGAVATFVNSRMFAFVICVVATLLWIAGWLSALGLLAPIAIAICYVLSIVYYIANKPEGGQ